MCRGAEMGKTLNKKLDIGARTTGQSAVQNTAALLSPASQLHSRSETQLRRDAEETVSRFRAKSAWLDPGGNRAEAMLPSPIPLQSHPPSTRPGKLGFVNETRLDANRGAEPRASTRRGTRRRVRVRTRPWLIISPKSILKRRTSPSSPGLTELTMW
eukprot:6209917-Pleurochrysis_carterae.AAC.1